MTRPTHQRHPISQVARREQNLIAHTIASNRLLPNLDALALGSSDAQRPPDETSSLMVDAGAAMFRAYRESVRYLLIGEVDRAREFAHDAAAFDRRYARLARAFDATRRTASGRFNDGDTWLVVIDDVPYYFDLILVYDEVANRLTVANGEELRHASGVLEATPDAWRHLARWVEEMHLEAPAGRPPDNPEEPIWREHKGSFELRESIKRAFPGMVFALEAIRLTLRSNRD